MPTSFGRDDADPTEFVISQLSLDEKLALLSGESIWTLSGCLKEKFDLPSIHVSDGPHGLRKCSPDTAAKSIPGTCFPTACTLANSWNEELLLEVGIALGKECWHQKVSVLLGPGMNIKRHPCGGRNFEYYSEDPVLSGRLAKSMVKGIQSPQDDGSIIFSCIKHFAANNHETRRLVTDAIIDERTLREVYLRGFEIAVRQSQPMAIMGAYNRLNGLYCCENKWLLSNVLREEWGFQGLILTDWGAMNDRVSSIIAGLDLEMPGSNGIHNESIREALDTGRLSEESLDLAVRRIIRLIQNSAQTLSEKNEKESAPNRQEAVASSYIECHHELAYRAALECAVLLKNTGNILPLEKNVSVALIGEFVKDPRFQGMGSSMVQATKLDTAFDQISKHTENFQYSQGYDREIADDDPTDESFLQGAVNVAKSAQVAIIFVGLPEISESESYDRSDLNLPNHHNKLVEAICDANENAIVVLTNGGPVTMPWVDKPKAILDGFLLGQAGGRAIMDLIFGVCSPNGKLGETFPVNLEDVPSYRYFPVVEGRSNHKKNRVEYREGLNIGYRYFVSSSNNIVPNVLFPFGHGLSYATFVYSEMKAVIVNDEEKDKRVVITCQVMNDSSITASEIVQCYVHKSESQVYRPEIELKDFCKVKQLMPGESREVEFDLSYDAFSFFDVGYSSWVVESGQYEVRIGASCEDIRLKEAIVFNTGTDPSNQARETSPPIQQALSSTPFIVNDEQFYRTLGKGGRMGERNDEDKDSTVGDDRLIHRNSLLQDIQHTWIGYLLVKITRLAALHEIRQQSPGKTLGEKEYKLADAFILSAPLRQLALFSKGYLTFNGIDNMIAIMNGHSWDTFYSYCKRWFVNPFHR